MNDFDPTRDKLPDLPVTIGGDKSAAAWHPNSGPKANSSELGSQVQNLIDRWHDTGGPLADQIVNAALVHMSRSEAAGLEKALGYWSADPYAFRDAIRTGADAIRAEAK